MADPFIWVRTIHFAATMLISGVVLFSACIGEPAFRKSGDEGAIPAVVRRRLASFAWASLLIVLISGALWLVLLAARMIDVPVEDVFSGVTIWTVITQTDFGHVWAARFVLAAVLAGFLPALPTGQFAKSRWKHQLAALVAAGLVGTLAWAGHAAAGFGAPGAIHLAADILHLIAASAWVGALVPLAVLLSAATRVQDATSTAVARDAVSRFSLLGTASVSTLLASGIVNTLMLAGSVPALIKTDYGRLLLLKIALFLIMFAVAGFNRLILSPRIAGEQASAGPLALRQLRRNSLIETAIAAIIITIVGVIGTWPPGVQELGTR